MKLNFNISLEYLMTCKLHSSTSKDSQDSSQARKNELVHFSTSKDSQDSSQARENELVHFSTSKDSQDSSRIQTGMIES
jgi:hypothetical protein